MVVMLVDTSDDVIAELDVVDGAKVGDTVGKLPFNVSIAVVISGNLPSPQNCPLKSSRLVSHVNAPPILLARTQLAFKEKKCILIFG